MKNMLWTQRNFRQLPSLYHTHHPNSWQLTSITELDTGYRQRKEKERIWMGRNPCSKEGLNRGAWTPAEDKILVEYIKIHGGGKWRNVPKKAGLKRCGKSCRLRWLNYLRPDIKRGNISHDEEELIIRLHKLLGNRWSLIAGRLPGRTDNEIKNYWNTTIGKKLLQDHQRQSQILSSSSTKPSYQCQVRPNLAVENSKSQSSKVETGLYLFKTKASKCKQPQPQKIDIQYELIDTKQLAACVGLSMADASVDNDHNVVKGYESSLPEFNLQQENNLSDDFMTGLQMYDHLLLFLDSTDFSQLSYFDNNCGPGYYNTTNNTYDQGCSLSPNSDQTLLFSEEKKKLHHSDFPSMESLIGSEFEWFGD